MNKRHYKNEMSGIKASLGKRKVRVKQSLGVSEIRDEKRIQKINNILKECDGARVMVYPVGAHTNFLFLQTDLKYKNVVAFADGLQKNYMGFEVRRPEPENFKDVDKIVISTYYHQQELEKILEDLGCKDKIVTLYDSDDMVPFYEVPNLFAPDFENKYVNEEKCNKEIIESELNNLEKEWSEKSIYKVKLNLFESVDDIKQRQKYETVNSNCAIVLQGQVIYDDDFTYNTVRLYKKIFKGAKIILSTWKEEATKKEFEKFREVLSEEEIVLSDPPGNRGILNVNYQIISSNAGFKRAKELGINYALKTRTDFRVYAEDCLAYLYKITKTFPSKTISKDRISILPAYADVPYYIPDYFFFGNVDDLCDMWDASSLFEDESEELNPEMLIFTKYTKKIGVYVENAIDNIKDYIDMLCSTFIITDYSLYKSIWKKYTYESLEQYQGRGNLINRTDWFNRQNL